MPARTLNDFFAGFFYASIKTRQEAGGGVKEINPSTFPGLKPGVCSGLILSGAFDPVLEDGVWCCRNIKVEGGREKEKEVILRPEVVSSKSKTWNHDNFLRDWNRNYSV